MMVCSTNLRDVSRIDYLVGKALAIMVLPPVLRRKLRTEASGESVPYFGV